MNTIRATSFIIGPYFTNSVFVWTNHIEMMRFEIELVYEQSKYYLNTLNQSH